MGSIIATPVTLLVSIFSSKPSDFIYWCKWIISYVYIQIWRRSTKKRLDLYDPKSENDPVKVGFISVPEEIALETPLEETQLYATSDEIFFYGVNSKSEYLVTRIARGVNNEAESWIYLKLKNGKVYQLKETTGYQQSCCEKKAFTCGDLQMHYITPMRRWRIFFNGLLRETDGNETESTKMVHVKFALIWCASSDVFDFTTDIKAEALAESFAKAKWKGLKPPLESFNRACNSYSQCGVIYGTMAIADSEEASEVYLFGERIRFMGDITLGKRSNFLHVLGQTPRTGSFIHLADISIENIVKDLKLGFLVRPTGAMSAAADIRISVENFNGVGEMENNIKANFNNEGETFNIVGNLTGKTAHFESKKGLHGQVKIDCVQFNMNSYKYNGIMFHGVMTNPIKRVIPPNPVNVNTPKDVPLVVHFSENICQDSFVTGGKGSSLGKLTELSKEFQTFIVPNGMVVTTSAYQKFITKDVLKEIKKLENVLYGNIPGDIKESCQRVMDEVVQSSIPNELLKAIETQFQKHFFEKGDVQFAVRSSATGEDTEQMSAAGQMETFLGVRGIDDILTAVKKCWASQFSHIAVQYKKQNGQIINSPMAVVIQKMVPCDVAGVLFTCDPLTGNPTRMTITANYGLGESVVSASEEPDTVELMRDFDDNLYIHNKIIGAKSQRIVLQGNESGGTNVQEIPENDRNSCCLTDEMSFRLGNLAVKIEKSYRSRRDIEWGFWNNNLYIFQSRPVTSGTGETDFEIDHELDAPMREEDDYFTVCNVGEVMPGAFSTLSVDVVMKYIRITFMKGMGSGFETDVKPKYFPRGIITMCSRVMFYCMDFLEKMDEDAEVNEGFFISLFGRKIEDDDMVQKAIERFDIGKKKKKPMFSGLFMSIDMFKRLFLSRRELDKALKFYKNYRIPVERYQTSQDLFKALLRACTDLTQAEKSHLRNTESSSIWNTFAISILKEARGGMSPDVYRDFALLCTCSEVESADIPSSIERLGSAITKEKTQEEFKKMSNQDAVEWLQNSQTEAGRQYREFLKRHGHRCLREFELRQKTWESDPVSLIQLLKNTAGASSKKEATKKENDFNKTMKNLGINVGLKTKLILKFLVSRSRQGVQTREISKSLLVRTHDEWRKAYYHLAKLMVSEGRIPDEDLLFFMTVDEIQELLETRSPKVIARANHRRRRYPIIDKYIFPEIMKGFPKPINAEDNTPISSEENFSMKGIPVSQGTVKAYVRVAITLEEAAQLQPGEILLTYSTDIGWSPYFPILAGVVTELGGLISHGAVVSREYGLPCIAGLHGATRQFQTGDYVLLDGNKGILQRLPRPSVAENQ